MTVTVKKIETEAVIVTDEVIVIVTMKKNVTVTRKITAREALTGSESDMERMDGESETELTEMMKISLERNTVQVTEKLMVEVLLTY